jgi:peptidase E
MSRGVHLVGGGPGALVQMRRHFKAALATCARKRPLVAYVGAASDDNVAFRKLLALGLGGARVEPVQLVSPRASTAAARQLLADSDLVFVSGGDVWRGMEVLRERGLVEEVRQIAAAGKPMLGVSAGAIMLAREWVRFPNDDDARAELFDCLAVAPVHIDCHSEDDGWSELRTLVRLLDRRGDPHPLGYGVPSRGCLLVEWAPHAEAPRLRALGASIARLRYTAGEVISDGALEVEP